MFQHFSCHPQTLLSQLYVMLCGLSYVYCYAMVYYITLSYVGYVILTLMYVFYKPLKIFNI